MITAALTHDKQPGLAEIVVQLDKTGSGFRYKLSSVSRRSLQRSSSYIGSWCQRKPADALTLVQVRLRGDLLQLALQALFELGRRRLWKLVRRRLN